jgi:hypothetical protein
MKDARALGRELGLRYVLEGSARKAGSQVRIKVQLIDSQLCLPGLGGGFCRRVEGCHFPAGWG